MNKQARPRLTEHGLEPVPGLPEALPSGEVLLWQGAPVWSEIAQRVFLVRWVGGYFVALVLWELMNGTLQGGMAADVIGPAMLLMLVGAVAIGILALLAKIVARTSVYSITSRRLVMRVGVALPITINIPFVALAGASLRNRKDGAGDIILELLPSHRISWIALWPHCGGWSFGHPKPMLRGIANAAAVAEILGNAVATSTGVGMSRSALGAESTMPHTEAAMA